MHSRKLWKTFAVASAIALATSPGLAAAQTELKLGHEGVPGSLIGAAMAKLRGLFVTSGCLMKESLIS